MGRVVWIVMFASLALGLPAARAQIRGDVQQLKLVAAQNRANREAIRTWQGEVEVAQRTIGTDKVKITDYRSVWRATYTDDRTVKKYIFLANQQEVTGIRDGQAVKMSDRLSWGGIRTPDGYSSVWPWYPDGKKGQPRRPELMVGPHNTEQVSEISTMFDPYWYMSVFLDPVYDRLMFFHENAHMAELSHITVSRTGSLVTVLLQKPDVGVNRYVFDLNQGANPVELAGEDALVTENHTRSFESNSDIWLPRAGKSISKNLKTGKTIESSVRWLKNVVNEPLPEDAFSPERVEIRQGDLIRDQRSGINYTYDASTDLADLDRTRRYWSIAKVAAITVAVAGVLLVGWRIRKRKAQGLKHGTAE